MNTPLQKYLQLTPLTSPEALFQRQTQEKGSESMTGDSDESKQIRGKAQRSSEVADLNDITSVYERGLSSTFSPSNAIIIPFLLLIALLNLPLFSRLLKADRTHLSRSK